MTSRTRYTIVISYPDRPNMLIPLTARTDKGAIRQLKKWMAPVYLGDGKKIFLRFYRPCDGTVGYLNRSGASHVGWPWNVD
jgi:hypothetical protein